MTTEKLTPPMLFDPWPNSVGPAQPRPVPDKAPGLWYLLSRPARGAVGAAVAEAMHAHPERTAPGDAEFLGHRVREQLTTWAEAGSEAARSALVEIDSPAVAGALILTDVARKLLDAGGEIGLLGTRIADDQRRLQGLERMRGPV
jgi:hypothetical protein